MPMHLGFPMEFWEDARHNQCKWGQQPWHRKDRRKISIGLSAKDKIRHDFGQKIPLSRPVKKLQKPIREALAKVSRQQATMHSEPSIGGEQPVTTLVNTETNQQMIHTGTLAYFTDYLRFGVEGEEIFLDDKIRNTILNVFIILFNI